LPLFEGNQTIELNPDQTKLTGWYTARAVSFIRAHRQQPFFLYVAHSMPHVPLHVSDEFRGRSRQGLYGDVIEEIDAGIGQILEAIRDEGLDEHTLVIFTTDNGPWLSYGNHAGSAGPLREGKGTVWEGGVRVPCIMRWPNKIPAGSECRELAATIDLLPTITGLCGARRPARRIDGLDIWPLLSGQPDASSPHESYYYYWGGALQAIRSGRWKLHFPHSYRSLTGEAGREGRPAGYSEQQCGFELYDLDADIGEQNNLAAQHPDVVARLEELAEQARADLGDESQQRGGQNVREPGRL
jgi:arylsulfatase A-like enzyme